MRKKENMVTVTEIAKAYKVTRQAVYLWIEKGQIPKPHKTPGGTMFWYAEELSDFAELTIDN